MTQTNEFKQLTKKSPPKIETQEAKTVKRLKTWYRKLNQQAKKKTQVDPVGEKDKKVQQNEKRERILQENGGGAKGL